MPSLRLPVLITLVLLAPFAVASGQAPRTLDWFELLPDADREAMERLPDEMERLNEKLLSEGADELSSEVAMPAVLSSTAVRPELGGQQVRIPGYIVPIELNDRGEATGFFLVPYFGACIHLPPPPPNQMVYVRFPEGIPGDQIYVPYWVTGPMSIETTENELGIATYSIAAQQIIVYNESIEE